MEFGFHWAPVAMRKLGMDSSVGGIGEERAVMLAVKK